MKRLISILLLLALVVFSFNCKKEECTTPEQTEFTGISTWVKDMDPGTTDALENGKVLITGQTAEWYDSASIAQVTGQSIWVINWLMDADFSKAQVWGTAVLNEGVKNEGDNATGKWEVIWEGTLTGGVVDPETGFFSQGFIDVDANGTGVSGNVEGMVGHWKYTMDISKGFVYHSQGYIK